MARQLNEEEKAAVVTNARRMRELFHLVRTFKALVRLPRSGDGKGKLGRILKKDADGNVVRRAQPRIAMYWVVMKEKLGERAALEQFIAWSDANKYSYKSELEIYNLRVLDGTQLKPVIWRKKLVEHHLVGKYYKSRRDPLQFVGVNEYDVEFPEYFDPDFDDEDEFFTEDNVDEDEEGEEEAFGDDAEEIAERFVDSDEIAEQYFIQDCDVRWRRHDALLRRKGVRSGRRYPILTGFGKKRFRQRLAEHKKRQRKYLTAFGETKHVSAWAADPRCRITRQTLVNRIAAGWLDYDAITTPAGKGGRPKKTV